MSCIFFIIGKRRNDTYVTRRVARLPGTVGPVSPGVTARGCAHTCCWCFESWGTSGRTVQLRCRGHRLRVPLCTPQAEPCLPWLLKSCAYMAVCSSDGARLHFTKPVCARHGQGTPSAGTRTLAMSHMPGGRSAKSRVWAPQT